MVAEKSSLWVEIQKMIPALKIAIGLAAAISVLWGGLSAPAEAADKERVGRPTGLWLSSRKVKNGQTLLLQIYTHKIRAASTAMKIIFQQHEYPVYRHPLDPDHRCFGLVAIPFRSPPGPAKLTLKWTNAAGNHTRTIPFDIVAGKYRTDELKVDAARVTPSKNNIKRVQRESRTVNRAYASGNVAGLWNGPFQLPIESRITSVFGNKRLFNGKLKSYHNGVDFRAPVGTSVRAANSGIVRVAKNLFYSGDAVIIDHGNNIFTIYAHLSKIKVKVGQQVKKGQQIGFSGATGRVNAPHLHWGVKISGVAADPIQFIKVMAALTGGRQ